jgi:thioredoxin 1
MMSPGKRQIRLVSLGLIFGALLIGCGKNESKPVRAESKVKTEPNSTVANAAICDSVDLTKPEGKNATPLIASTSIPRMLELGSVGCQPCEKMTPILEELRKEFGGKLSVEFYDVRKDPEPARQYGIKLIPTQIFVDASGKEIFRHEGFFAKEEIIPILAQMGVKK